MNIKVEIATDEVVAINEHTAKNAPWMDHVHLGHGYCGRCGKYVVAGETAQPRRDKEC